jgi:hypothetical protein
MEVIKILMILEKFGKFPKINGDMKLDIDILKIVSEAEPLQRIRPFRNFIRNLAIMTFKISRYPNRDIPFPSNDLTSTIISYMDKLRDYDVHSRSNDISIDLPDTNRFFLRLYYCWKKNKLKEIKIYDKMERISFKIIPFYRGFKSFNFMRIEKELKKNISNILKVKESPEIIDKFIVENLKKE